MRITFVFPWVCETIGESRLDMTKGPFGPSRGLKRPFVRTGPQRTDRLFVSRSRHRRSAHLVVARPGHATTRPLTVQRGVVLPEIWENR